MVYWSGSYFAQLFKELQDIDFFPPPPESTEEYFETIMNTGRTAHGIDAVTLATFAGSSWEDVKLQMETRGLMPTELFDADCYKLCVRADR